jgi:gamma-glutamyl-gamma-aminobutyrate hydrolase PuuD
VVVGGLTLDKTPKYYLVRNDNQIRQMFGKYGYTRVFNLTEADFVVFPGGADINPFLYGEGRLPTTFVNHKTDVVDIQALRRCRKGQVKIGICRGAQFLNVMVGNGKLYQHVDNHATIKGHVAYEALDPKKAFVVSSTHHQMMIPGASGRVLLAAKEASHKETDLQVEKYDTERRVKELDDVEAVIYPEDDTFCFQPHPELPDEKYKDCRNWFFDVLSTYYLTADMEKAALAKTHEIKSGVKGSPF